jgi:hypothetical protein
VLVMHASLETANQWDAHAAPSLLPKLPHVSMPTFDAIEAIFTLLCACAFVCCGLDGVDRVTLQSS